MTSRTCFALIATLLVGCGAATPSADTVEPPVARDTTALATRSLSASSLARAQLLSSPAGRSLLTRVVACALPRGASITAITQDGTPYSFAGDLGLAPAWGRHAATRLEHERVAACVAVPHPIALRA